VISVGDGGPADGWSPARFWTAAGGKSLAQPVLDGGLGAVLIKETIDDS